MMHFTKNKTLPFILLTLAPFLRIISAAASSCSSSDSRPAPYNISPEQIATFERDGIIVLRGLLKGRELDDAINAAESIHQSKGLFKRFIYNLKPVYKDLEFQTWRKNPALEKVAFESAAPTICAKLMGLDKDVESASSDGDGDEDKEKTKVRPLRLLKDAFLGYKAGDVGCGWHVDDKVFWPTEDKNIGQRDAGINVWITLSPVTAAEGGGLAIAPTSHRQDFAKTAREAIGKGPFDTCNLKELSPESHDRMEELKVVHDLRPGDAIIHNRYVFHRAEPFLDPIEGTKAGTKLRISMRYVPADATYYDNNSNADNRVIEIKDITTGDPVSKGEEYFPQVWPHRLPEEQSSEVLSDTDLFSFGRVFKMLISGGMKAPKEDEL